MKTIFLVSLFLIATSNAKADSCEFREDFGAKTVYSLPVYEIKGNYFFSRKEKVAFAIFSWGLNSKRTRECLEKGKRDYPEWKAVHAAVHFDQLTVKSQWGKKSAPLTIYPQANGHWFGESDKIELNYEDKTNILSAIKGGQHLVSVEGKREARHTMTESTTLGEIECGKKNMEVGVLNLVSRLNEIKKIAEERSPDGVNPELLLEEFLGSCVKFVSVDASSFVEFDQSLRVKSRIIAGKIPLRGTKRINVYESFFVDKIQTLTPFEI